MPATTRARVPTPRELYRRRSYGKLVVPVEEPDGRKRAGREKGLDDDQRHHSQEDQAGFGHGHLLSLEAEVLQGLRRAPVQPRSLRVVPPARREIALCDPRRGAVTRRLELCKR